MKNWTGADEGICSQTDENSHLIKRNVGIDTNDFGNDVIGHNLIAVDQRGENRSKNDAAINQRCVLLSLRKTVTFLVLGVMLLWVAAILCTLKLDIMPTHRDYELIDGNPSSLLALTQALAIRKAQNEANEAIELLRSPLVDSGNGQDNDIQELFPNDTASISYLDFMDGQWNESAIDTTNISVPLLGHSHNHKLNDGCELTVMLVRHCEKGSVREHCDFNGFERSVYLASQFGDGRKDRWPLPSYIFALNPSGRQNEKKLNLREIETVLPLAKKTGVRIDDSYNEGEEYKLAKDMINHMKTGKMCGKLAIISWKHSLIGHLARKFGCGPSEGCPQDYRGKDFDSVWLLRFLYATPQHSLRKSLKLEHGPSWFVYGSVQREGFDPLAMSKQYGDYPSRGTPTAGRWIADTYAYPERYLATEQCWI
jgi:hypothetical protein